MSALADYARELRRQIDLFERARELDSLTLESDRSKVMAHSDHWTRQDGRRFEFQSALDDASGSGSAALIFEILSGQRSARSRVERLLVRHKRSIDQFHQRALAEAERRGFYGTMAPLLVKALKQHRRILESHELMETWQDQAVFDWDRMRDSHAAAVDAFEIRLPVESPEPPGELASKPAKRRRSEDSGMEARDLWIYEQCCRLVPYDTIAIKLKKKPKSWPRISTKQGIRQTGAKVRQKA